MNDVVLAVGRHLGEVAADELNGPANVLEHVGLRDGHVQGALRVLKHGQQADHDNGQQRDRDHHFQQREGGAAAEP